MASPAPCHKPALSSHTTPKSPPSSISRSPTRPCKRARPKGASIRPRTPSTTSPRVLPPPTFRSTRSSPEPSTATLWPSEPGWTSSTRPASASTPSSARSPPTSTAKSPSKTSTSQSSKPSQTPPPPVKPLLTPPTPFPRFLHLHNLPLRPRQLPLQSLRPPVRLRGVPHLHLQQFRNVPYLPRRDQ